MATTKKAAKRPNNGGDKKPKLNNSPVIIKSGSLAVFCADFPPGTDIKSSKKKWKKKRDAEEPELGDGLSLPKDAIRISRVVVEEINDEGICTTLCQSNVSTKKCRITIEYEDA